MKSKLEELKKFAKQEKVFPIAFVEQVDDGYLDANGKIHKSLSSLKARVVIVDDIPPSQEGECLDG